MTHPCEVRLRLLPIAEEKRGVIGLYLDVKKIVIDAGLEQELEWQARVEIANVCESDFLSEAAWVILSAGMRESVIRSIYPMIFNAFGGFQSASQVVNNREKCFAGAFSVFRNRRKIQAILDLSERVADEGFEAVKLGIRSVGVEYLYRLPFMGPATAAHLAKNIGLSVCKPDRHLVRIARCLGYSSASLLCEEIANTCGDKASVVDLVLWRFATLHKKYLKFIQERI